MMKRVKFLIILLIASGLLQGCKKNGAPDVRDSFVSTYLVKETWTENNKTMIRPDFTMSVEKSSVHDEVVLMNNFADYGAGVSAEAKVTGREITIPQQILPNSKSIAGSGVLADTSLTFTYTETIGTKTFIVTATAKKR